MAGMEAATGACSNSEAAPSRSSQRRSRPQCRKSRFSSRASTSIARPRLLHRRRCIVCSAWEQTSRPAHLAGVSPEALRPLGFSRAKALSIVALAAAIETGTFDADAIDSLDNEKAVAALMHLRGIGRWSAEYALLRGLGRLNVFPGDDVGARNNLAHRLQRKGPLDYAAVQAAVQPWQPFAGLVYFHLLLANLADQGVLIEPAV